MKHLRKLAGISVLLILVFMVIALIQFQAEGDTSLLPDQFEYYYNENWTVVSLDGTQAAGSGQEDTADLSGRIYAALESGAGKISQLPYTQTEDAGRMTAFINTLPEEYAGLTMSFTTCNAQVTVILDGEEIYQYKPDEESLRTVESYDNFIDVPNVFENGEMSILLTPIQQNAALSIGDIKIETRDLVVIGVVGNNIADIGCCLLILLTAIIMFVLALIRAYTGQPARGEVFLGLTGVTAGIYCFIGTDTLSIFYNVQEAYEMQEYLVLLLPLFLTLYFEKNFHTIYPRRFTVLLWIVILNGVFQIALHQIGVRDLEDMLNISAAAVGAVCVAALISLVQYDYTNRGYRTLLAVLSMLVLLAGGIANVILNTAFSTVRGNTAGQYSMVVFSVMMAFMHTLQISKEYRASAEKNADLLAEKVKAAEQQNIQLAQAKQDAEAARQEALAANEAKGRFLAHMSHEIRTPINAVLGMDEMILRESKEQNIKEYAMDIYMAGQTLLSLINDILDFSKIESGKMEIVPVDYDISSLIHDLVNMASQRAKEKELCLKVEVDQQIPSRLFGDDVRIRQVLTNILTNAVKYTHEGTVWLRVKCRKNNENALLYFEVEDTGIGIREEDLPKLSAEFERIEEDRNRNIEGTGLGMSITIQLLALLGSKLKAESVYGKGSRFYFELEQRITDDTPIGDFESRVQQIAENYNYSSKFCAPDAKILVVDDNAVNRKVLRNLLRETQIQVMDAQGGAECLDLVQKEHFDLIFLDHMMPEMDGVETLHHIREFSDFPCKDTPVVVLTANAVSGAKEKYLEEGFDDFLSKPIMPEKLESMIKKMLPEELLLEADKTEAPQSASLARETAQSADDFLEGLPQVDGMDWQYAWMHLPDPELLEFTVKEFYDQIGSAAERLNQSYIQIKEPGQLEQYRIQVHAMKSLAATVGIAPLSGVAKILEYAARDAKFEVILSMTVPFLEEWRSYEHKLKGVFGIGAAGKKVTDYSLIQALVEMLRLSMQEMDIDRADQLAGQLKEYDYPDEMEPYIRKIADAVTNLDSDETERLAEALLHLTGQMTVG